MTHSEDSERGEEDIFFFSFSFLLYVSRDFAILNIEIKKAGNGPDWCTNLPKSLEFRKANIYLFLLDNTALLCANLTAGRHQIWATAKVAFESLSPH